MENHNSRKYSQMIEDATQFNILIQQLDESEGVCMATLISEAVFETLDYIPNIPNAARLLVKIIKKRGFFPKLVDYFLLYPLKRINYIGEDFIIEQRLLDPYMINQIIMQTGKENNLEVKKKIQDVAYKVFCIIDDIEEH